jgi:glucose/arabinose dehydrogenase
MAFYAAQTFPQWQHKLFIGALKETSLIVLAVDGNQVREEGACWRRAGNASATFAWDPTAICMC